MAVTQRLFAFNVSTIAALSRPVFQLSMPKDSSRHSEPLVTWHDDAPDSTHTHSVGIDDDPQYEAS